MLICAIYAQGIYAIGIYAQGILRTAISTGKKTAFSCCDNSNSQMRPRLAKGKNAAACQRPPYML